MRRERARRRRLRVLLSACAWLALLVAVGVAFASVATAEDALRGLSSPGIWVPFGVLVAAVVIVVAVRRTLGRCTYSLGPEQLVARPTPITRILSGAKEQTLSIATLVEIQLLETHYGAELVLHDADETDGAGSVRFPLDHPAAAEVIAALPDLAAWEPLATHVLEAFGQGSLPDTWQMDSVRGDRALAGRFQAAGLWQLAAEALWPAVLGNPGDPELARQLNRVQRCNLPTSLRQKLGLALCAHHPEDPAILMDLARLYLAYRAHEDAHAVLDRLVAQEAPTPVVLHWRAVLRQRRQVPVPPSKAPLGIEINLPHHRIEGTELVVDGRFKAGLEWFLGYRLLPGFWGPPRAIQLVDVWGATHVLQGDPMDWAARLERAAPHLCELHDEGLLWPGTGKRIRRLRASAPRPG